MKCIFDNRTDMSYSFYVRFVKMQNLMNQMKLIDEQQYGNAMIIY